MTPEEERWAEALQIERLLGADASAWIARRLAALTLAGDTAGVERFRAIAARFEQLLVARRGPAS